MLGTRDTLVSEKDVLKLFGIEERVSNYCHTNKHKIKSVRGTTVVSNRSVGLSLEGRGRFLWGNDDCVEIWRISEITLVKKISVD